MENQCCLCGSEEGKEIQEEGENQEKVYACSNCILEAVTGAYYRREEKKPWYKTQTNWGFWVLAIGFIAYLITWFVIKPMLENGG